MINGFATALDITAQAASTMQLSALINIPGFEQNFDGSGPKRRTTTPPRMLLMTINVTAIVDTPDLDVIVRAIDRASGTFEILHQTSTIQTTGKTTVLIGDTAITAAGIIDTVTRLPIPAQIQVAGTTDAGTGTPTIDYTVGIEAAY